MGVALHFALAFALSLVAAGGLQQAIMLAAGERDALIALFFVVPVVALVTGAFAVALRRRRRKRLRWAAGLLLAAMLVLGGAIYAIGRATLVPGIAGNIGYLLALFVDLYVLLPSAIAVPVHAWVLHPLTATAEGATSTRSTRRTRDAAA